MTDQNFENWLDSVAYRVVRDAQKEGIVPAGTETMELIANTRDRLAEVFTNTAVGDTTVNAAEIALADYMPPKNPDPYPGRDPQKHGPAVPINQSVQHEYLVCLEDGKKLKILTRYIRNQYGLDPKEYREKWRLPPDYPMVAPAHSRKRSRIAHETGLADYQKKSGQKTSGTTSGDRKNSHRDNNIGRLL